MGLSRLDNFLKNIKGEILYVDPSSLDSTDSIENQGNSLTRPFKTIQRALIEAARFSYQRGLDNDRFGKTTILLYPGEHIVDNRPGWIPYGSNNFLLRSSDTSSNFPPLSGTTDFNLSSPDNQLYKFNSISGGVIVPRGTSIVGLDLRKTKIRPKYIPDPENDVIERAAIFKLTGSSYIWQFTILDADPNGVCYKDYTTNLFIPNFSHHKLTCFEYADGINSVKINDGLISNYSTDRTDLDMYYEKIGIAYGEASGRNISPDYPSTPVDIQTKIDEYRIVGSTGEQAPIASIYAGDAIDSSTTITVVLSEPLSGIDVDTPIQIQNVDTRGYNGQYVVSEVLNDTTFRYQVQNPPIVAAPPANAIANANLVLVSDTVTSASPYIFNCSLRSVYGMCGLHADGNKASGFKSMVVAQFTGIGLQKDDNAFVLYNPQTGAYQDRNSVSNLYSNSRAVYNPEYENYHIKASNNAFVQIVSVFAIGYAKHFVAESGGDLSITNSNSNFGAKSLVASGYRTDSFATDDFGYITHIVPPREIEDEEVSIEFTQIDVTKTNSVNNPNRLYLYQQTNRDILPENVTDGYRIGAKVDEDLSVVITKNGTTQTYSSRIIMTGGTGEYTSEKSFFVSKKANNVSNNITNNIITLTQPHSFANGETVRIISDTGHLPEGISNNKFYYVITNQVATGIGSTQIKLAQSYNEALIGSATEIYSNETSELNVVSRVTDKKCGDIGHPVQFDNVNGQWYIGVSSTSNNIKSAISNLVVGATARTYFTRKPDTRSFVDSIYRLRYVIPKGFLQARVPLDGYVIQESGSTLPETNLEIQKYLSLDNQQINATYELRNLRIIANATWTNNVVTITTEIPHDLIPGSEVTIKNIVSTVNTQGLDDLGYNGKFVVTSVPDRKAFTFALTSNPGIFSNNTSARTVDLPYFTKNKYTQTYIIYRSQEIQKYIPGEQDGVYHLIVLNASNSPNIAPFNEGYKFLQPIQNLYPQSNRDNISSDPSPARSFASPGLIGEVIVNDPEKSITKETVAKNILDSGVGLGVTNIISGVAGTSHVIHTKYDHGLNRITSVSIVNAGSNYGSGIGISETFYNARLVGIGTTVVGDHASAMVRIDQASGSLIDVKIVDGGSAYGIGNTLAVVGIATTTGHTLGFVRVDSIYSNINDAISVFGVIPDKNSQYNTTYRITNIPVGATRRIEVVSASIIPPANPGVGIGITFTTSAVAVPGQPTIGISTINYSASTGIATVTTNRRHGLSLNNKIRIGGANHSYYNKNYVVKSIVDSNKFEVKVGVQTITTSPVGDMYVYLERITSHGGAVSKKNENISGRLVSNYAGITTALDILEGEVTGPDIDSIVITNATSYNFQVGDYLQINDEIMRIRETVVDREIQVFRGVLGTFKTTHPAGSKVVRIRPVPVELRRNSIIRASGHTFEYLGFGPGNYSTALPERQNRKLTPTEELLSASTKLDGGVAVYTAMDSDGAFFIGNKKINSATGQEQVFNTPVPSVRGEDLGSEGVNIGFDILSPLEVTINRSLKVEGGEDGTIISRFDAPVVFTNRITSTSSKGIEATSLFLQGSQLTSKKYTVGISAPLEIGSPGDVVYNANPETGGYLGWVYTTSNKWEQFGPVKDGNVYVGIWSGIFVGDGSGLFNVSDVWRRDIGGVGIVTTSSVGIGTTLTKNGVSLYVNGNARVDGITTFNNTAQSISTSTGAVVVKGGVGIEKSVNIGGDLSVSGIATFTDLYADNIVGFTTFSDDITFLKNVNVSGMLSTRHLYVSGIGTFGTNLYVRNQSIRAFVNGTAIIFGV